MLNTLQNIQIRALALRSSIHNEHQLSAIELTAMCAKKTNELIDVINELCEFVKTHLTADGVTTVAYDEQTEGLNIGG